MTILSFFKKHFTNSRYASDQAIYDFACVARDQELPLDYGNDRRLAELLTGNEDAAGSLEQIANLLGQAPQQRNLTSGTTSQVFVSNIYPRTWVPSGPANRAADRDNETRCREASVPGNDSRREWRPTAK